MLWGSHPHNWTVFVSVLVESRPGLFVLIHCGQCAASRVDRFLALDFSVFNLDNFWHRTAGGETYYCLEIKIMWIIRLTTDRWSFRRSPWATKLER